MAGILASLILPSLLGIGGRPRKSALRRAVAGLPKAPTGRAQARAGVSRRLVLKDQMMSGGSGNALPPKRKRATAGKKKVSVKQLAALAKGRATAARNRRRK